MITIMTASDKEMANRIAEHFADQAFSTKVMMFQGATDCNIRDAMYIMQAAENKQMAIDELKELSNQVAVFKPVEELLK